MKARRVKKLDPDGRLDENAARIVLVRLDEVRELAPKALAPDAGEAQHDLRIAAKRLRYVLEITGFCFHEPADSARKRARDLQEVLGDIHDCDVMLPLVLDQLDALRAEDAAGLEALGVHLSARRRALFEDFLRSWAEDEQRGTWLRLERAARAVLSEPRPSQAGVRPQPAHRREG